MTSFSKAIADLIDLRPRVTSPNDAWFILHRDEINAALKAGVTWDSIYTLGNRELPEPLSFAEFAAAFVHAQQVA